MSQEPGWITKTEAAALLGCDERTIERRARAGRLNTRTRPGFPTLYLAASVEMLRQTSPGEVQAGILESVPPHASNGHGRHTAELTKSALSNTPSDDPIRQLAALVVHALTHPPTGPTGPTIAPTGPTLTLPERLFLTIPEAAALSGFSQAYLRRKCQAGWTGAIKDGAWKIRRKDLEAL